MGLSIHEHMGEASVRHHVDRVEYPTKRLFSGTGSTSLNYYYTHPIQTPEHLFYNITPASIPGRGAGQIQSLVHGAGANGVGITFPPPRPGSLCLVAEPGRGRLVSLGSLRAHGVEGEIGLDKTDREGNLVRSSSHLAIPVSYDGNGFSIVSSIPRPGLNNPLSGSPLFTELPANVQFQSFSNATSYDLNIGSSHRLGRSEPSATIGVASNGTAELEALANQFIINNEYADFLSGADGNFYFTDPTQKVPTVYSAITAETDESQSGLDKQKAEDEAYLNQLDQLLRLPVQQEQFNALTYKKLQAKSIAAWKEDSNLKKNLNSPGFLEDVTDFLTQINQYLPAALGVVNLIKDLTKSDAAVIETESYAIDPQTLTLTPTLKAELNLINKYLNDKDLVVYNYQTKVLTLAGRKFYVGRRAQLDSTYIANLETLNRYLPPALAIKIYRNEGVATAIRVLPGMFVEADSGLVIPSTIDPVGKSLARLHCYLPANIYSALAARVVSSSGSAPEIVTSLDSTNPAQANNLLQELTKLVTDLTTDDPVAAALKQVDRYLPADLKGLFQYDKTSGLKFNAERALQSGISLINKELPSWLNLSASFSEGKFKGFSVGPLSLDFSNGIDFSLDFEKLLNLASTLDLLDILSDLPVDARDLKGLIQSVRYPHDRAGRDSTDSFGLNHQLSQLTRKAKTVKVGATFPRSLKSFQKFYPYSRFSDDSLTTINTGGNLDSKPVPELNINSFPNGSPFPLLLVTSEILTNVQKIADAIIAKPQSTSTGRSPITGKSYSVKQNRAYCIGETIPLLDIASNPRVANTPVLPTPQAASSTGTLVTLLGNKGLGVSAAPLINSLGKFVAAPTITGFLSTIAIATTDTRVQQTFSAAAVSLGESPEEFVPIVRAEQEKLQPSCSRLSGFEDSLGELDGSQDSLSDLLAVLEIPDFLLSSALHSQKYVRDWLAQIDPALVPAMEYLAKGDLFYFLVEVIYYRTGIDLMQSPQQALRLKQMIYSRYQQVAPGFSLLDELLND